MSTRRKTSHVLACLLLGMVSIGAVLAALLAGDVTVAEALGAGLVTLVVTAGAVYTLAPEDQDPLRGQDVDLRALAAAPFLLVLVVCGGRSDVLWG